MYANDEESTLSTYHALLLIGRHVRPQNQPKQIIGPANLRCSQCMVIADAAFSGENLIGKFFPGYFPWRTVTIEHGYQFMRYESIGGAQIVPGVFYAGDGYEEDESGWALKIQSRTWDNYPTRSARNPRELKKIAHEYLLGEFEKVQQLKLRGLTT